MGKTVIILTGPTSSGKSALAVELARSLGTEIVSADSRQIYHGIPIVTAMPTPEERNAVRHHLIDILPLDAYYSAAEFETDALSCIDKIFQSHDVAVVCGGSMMYVDALCGKLDSLPTVPSNIRSHLEQQFKELGEEWLLEELRVTDSEYFKKVDLKNLKRVFHAIEISRTAGTPYSSLLSKPKKERNFKIIKIALNLPREELFDRINKRVDRMVEDGLEEEARRVFHLRALNSLNTVGLKEMFRYIDGEWDFNTAVERIKKNTRVYAKKQITWYKKDSDIVWMSPEEVRTMIIQGRISSCR